MTHPVRKRQGRMRKPLQGVLFISALLAFIFTVVYRMTESTSFSTAMATLVESLLIVTFFIFLGVLLAYLLFCMYARRHPGPGRRDIYDLFESDSGQRQSGCKPDRSAIGQSPENKARPLPDS